MRYVRAVHVTANGKHVDLAPGATVADLVERLGLAARSVVVERNGEPVARTSFGRVALEEGDRLEVVRPVQGGSGGRSETHRAEPPGDDGGSGSLDQARLYLVTPSSFRSLDAVLRAGVDIVQLRDKDAADVDVLREAQRFAKAAADARVPFVLNDRPDLALAAGADGVHVGQEDVPPAVARRILGAGAVVGRSTHSEEQIVAAIAEHDAGDVDYIAVGPVHHTATHPEREAVGYELVRFAASNVTFPWFAIGGIDPSNVEAVADAGARRICVVRAIIEAPDPVEAVAALLERLPCP
jgi:thiamine-phosphate pyrophosphorylase